MPQKAPGSQDSQYFQEKDDETKEGKLALKQWMLQHLWPWRWGGQAMPILRPAQTGVGAINWWMPNYLFQQNMDTFWEEASSMSAWTFAAL